MLRLTTLSCALLLALPMAAETPNNTLTEEERAQGYRLLFDGKSLAGWDGDPEVWSVEDGTIVGSTENKKIQANTFLISNGVYADFVLDAEVKLRNHNSGIQFRSERHAGYVVHGYQADAAAGNWWGSLYGEKTGRGVIQNGWKGKGETVVKRGEWNHVRITCKGDHVQIELNGLTTVELDDDMSKSGIIALQVHQGDPMQVRFRNVKIRPL